MKAEFTKFVIRRVPQTGANFLAREKRPERELIPHYLRVEIEPYEKNGVRLARKRVEK